MSEEVKGQPEPVEAENSAESTTPGSAPETEPAPQDAAAAELDELSQEAGALYDEAVAETSALKAKITELEEQLKRDQAEYVNSRRRIENNAEQGKQNAIASVLNSLLSTLDDIELARQHGDLADGSPFAAIATKLEETLKTQGLERFGAVGDEFDPALHEALMHSADESAESTTLQVVMQPGYKVGERILRPARVGTVGPN